MNFLIENQNQNVSFLKKEGTAGDYRITWDRKGVNEFLVISAQTKQEVLVKNNVDLQETISRISRSIKENLTMTIDGVSFYYVSFSELIKNGGLSIKERPGYYSVYACDIENNEIINLYYSDNSEKTINISVDIEINQSDCNIEVKKSLFKKEIQYSGFKAINVPRGIKGIAENSVKYAVSNYVFSIPNQVLEQGGTFYVKCPKEQSIRFLSSNNGIRIK